MSEYWKSTPKYWCKFCETYVRDTKFERQQHESTPKHQNAIQRSLRQLHNAREREEREKQRAKNEVARLNGVVSGAAGSSKEAPWTKAAPAAPPKQATAEDRKRQLKQLADMGVAVPEEFRREMAMTGDWQTVSVTPLNDSGVKKEEAEDVKPDGLNVGVRKRKLEGDEDEDEAMDAKAKKKGWGTSFKAFPGSKDAGDDIEALLGGPKTTTAVKTEPSTPAIKTEETTELANIPEAGAPGDQKPSDAAASIPAVKTEEGAPSTGVVFKKRKSKA
ncbi:hypothetical protein K490DRAFT_20639, partial [Saccharata proteae CBS 121410]